MRSARRQLIEIFEAIEVTMSSTNRSKGVTKARDESA
jgi:hypothetical protein